VGQSWPHPGSCRSGFSRELSAGDGAGNAWEKLAAEAAPTKAGALRFSLRNRTIRTLQKSSRLKPLLQMQRPWLSEYKQNGRRSARSMFQLQWG